MKRILTTIIAIFAILNLFSQDYWDYQINFEDPEQFFRLKIDTISNPDNIWQIGTPSKPIFSSALSLPNAIVTDTINSYPTNDTSVFVIEHVAEYGGFQMPHTVLLQGQYQVNSDTITDFGKIEFSPDNGVTWVDLLTDEVYYNMGCYSWWTDKPTLSGNSTGWSELCVWVAGFGPVFDIQYGDTVRYRFTFISDDLQTNKDGLIYDNLQFQDWAEAIESISKTSSLNVFPNPTSNIATIKFENENSDIHELVLLDSKGLEILLRQKTTLNEFEVNLNNSKPDTYFYLISNLKTGKKYSGKIVRE